MSKQKDVRLRNEDKTPHCLQDETEYAGSPTDVRSSQRLHKIGGNFITVDSNDADLL
jgi:hypothetical protein